MKLTIIGGVGSTANISTQATRMIEVCRGLKDGVGLTGREMGDRLGILPATVRQHATHPALLPFIIHDYRYSKKGIGNVYANAKTVKEHNANSSH